MESSWYGRPSQCIRRFVFVTAFWSSLCTLIPASRWSRIETSQSYRPCDPWQKWNFGMALCHRSKRLTHNRESIWTFIPATKYGHLISSVVPLCRAILEEDWEYGKSHRLNLFRDMNMTVSCVDAHVAIRRSYINILDTCPVEFRLKQCVLDYLVLC